MAKNIVFIFMALWIWHLGQVQGRENKKLRRELLLHHELIHYYHEVPENQITTKGKQNGL